MAKPPDFNQPTIDLLSQRSAMICNNPECLTVTVGPSDVSPNLKLKLGEAAHIRPARKDNLRFDSGMTDVQRADISNGIWLCANCHTMIDKNDGRDFPVPLLETWKQEHAEMISILLRSHRSPIAYLRRVTKEGQIAQAIVDVLDQHGVLFQPMNLENSAHVIQSVAQLRKRLGSMVKEVQYDRKLKSVLQQLNRHLRDFMNFTSQNSHFILAELPTMRNRVGQELKLLRDQYGCIVPQNLSIIVPN